MDYTHEQIHEALEVMRECHGDNWGAVNEGMCFAFNLCDKVGSAKALDLLGLLEKATR